MMTELRPTSLPVPAVVGMVMHGASPLQSALKSNGISGWSGRLRQMRMTLPTSNALPPPKAITPIAMARAIGGRGGIDVLHCRIRVNPRKDAPLIPGNLFQRFKGVRANQPRIGDHQRLLEAERGQMLRKVRQAPRAEADIGWEGKTCRHIQWPDS